ncbi:MAG: hypothetical protein PUC41_07980 [Oscillospiraceae bacterium]|nr:hypothetical protein [Oscillospiraceae bacterium]
MFRKIASIVSAIAFLACVSSLRVSASGIKDLNSDGRYTIGDVIFLNRYLIGAVDYAGAVTDLDINGNYIIDTVDAQVYLAYLGGQ